MGGVAGGDLQSVAKSKVSEEGVFRLRRRELGSQVESGVEGGGQKSGEWKGSCRPPVGRPSLGH